MSRGSALAVALYRSIFSAVRTLEGKPLRLRLPLDRSSARWPPKNDKQFEILPARSAARELFPTLEPSDVLDASEGIEPDALRDIIRTEFRQACKAASEGTDTDVVGIGLHALKMLHEQLTLVQRSSYARTQVTELNAAVVVEASSMYLGRDGPLHVFSYRLRIYNVGRVPVQVIGRQWEICNDDGTVYASVPRGSPGLVGQTPRLEPGGMAFEYASGTQLSTPGGFVRGSLQMMSLESGKEPQPFDAEVGEFRCLVD